MPSLSDIRTEQVRQLIRQMPDKALQTLESALAYGGADPKLGEVKTLVGAEKFDRGLGLSVLLPILPLFKPNPFASFSFPPDTSRRLWAAMKADEPGLTSFARDEARALKYDDDPPPVFDDLCRIASERLKSREGEAFAALAASLDARQAGAASRLGDLLALAPIARAAMPRLQAWIRVMGDDCVAALRVAYRDATEVGEDLAPVFTEMMAAQLEHPHQVLRLISAVMDRPSDRYLSSSEMAPFGERLLAELEQQVDAVRRFDPHSGAEAGAALAAGVLAAVNAFGEFEQWLNLNREGPWGSRIATMRRSLATGVETRLKELVGAVAVALPSAQHSRLGRSGAAKGLPRLDQDPNPRAIEKARGLLALLAESRPAAGYGGFGSMRNKVIEDLGQALDHYAEEVLEALHGVLPPVEAERARAYLEFAAEFLGYVREPKAAELVRRRAAAA